MSGYGAGELVVGAGADDTGLEGAVAAGFEGEEAACDGAFQTTAGAVDCWGVALGVAGAGGGGLDTRGACCVCGDVLRVA